MVPNINYDNIGIKHSRDKSISGKDLIIGGIVLTGSVWAIRKIAQALKPVPEKKTLRYTADELQQLNKNPNTAQTLTEVEAHQYADELFQAMDGYGTGEKTIYRIMRKLNNNADYLALSKAFGYREISSGTWNPEKNFKGNLAGALVNELNDAEEINKVNAIFKSKKIKYRL